jgi:hypothetical protein
MRKTILLLALAAGLALTTHLNADEKEAVHAGTWFKVAMTTEGKYSENLKVVFAPDAPAVYAVYRVVAAGPVKLKAVFWADSVEGFDPRTKLFEKVISISERGEFMGAVSAQRPTDGWPAGLYHVDLFIGDTLSKTLSYKVVKGPGKP